MQAVGEKSKIFTMQIIRRNLYGATYGELFHHIFFTIENHKIEVNWQKWLRKSICSAKYIFIRF